MANNNEIDPLLTLELSGVKRMSPRRRPGALVYMSG